MNQILLYINMNNKSLRSYQICTRCVMDTSDSKIEFDKNGVCDHCRNFDKNIMPYLNSKKHFNELKDIACTIKNKNKNKNKKYDCLLALSGGVDSCYTAYIVKEVLGLRPLAYVCDTGWNLEFANKNIDNIINKLNIDCYKEKIDFDEMADIQLAAFKSGTVSVDMQDHAIFAGIYNFAIKNKIKYVVTGSNTQYEFIRPPVEWIPLNDIVLIKDIQKKFGTKNFKTYPLCSMFKYRILYQLLFGMKRIYPLNYIDYNKEEAEKLLIEKFNYTKYNNKHQENILTRFIEGYYLPKKFGYDTRKNVFSNRVLMGTMTRNEALKLLKEPSYDLKTMLEDKKFIAKKLKISEAEFDDIISRENKTIYDYKNSYFLIKIAVSIAKLFGIENRNIKI